MNLIKDRIFLGSIALILFFYLLFFLVQIDFSGTSRTQYLALTSSYLISFNIIIICAWFAFGWIGGAFSLAFSIIIALSLYMISGSRLYYLHIMFFLITALFSFKSLKLLVGLKTEYLLKREKIEGERNTLLEKLEKNSAQTEALKLKLKRYEALKSIAEYLSDIFSQDKLVRFLVDRSFEIVGKSTRSIIYLVDQDHQELILTYSKQPPGLPKIKAKKGDRFDKWVLRQNQPLIILDAAKDFRFPHDETSLDEINFESMIAVPMTSHNKIMGLLRLDSQEVDAYSPDDLRLLDIIGDLGAVSLHNNMLYQRTTELAIRDGLTQLFVHRYFMERLIQELQRAIERDHFLSLLMIDIDHFKDYNDRYGHIAGDILLKHLAELFKTIVTKDNIVARYGGEEFAVILFDSDKETSRALAERMREKVKIEPFYLRREVTHATVSIGISTLPSDAKSCEDLLRIADQNLYRAKREGRNMVCTG